MSDHTLLPGEGGGQAFPRFFIQTEQNAYKSERSGSAVFDDIEMVEIIVPGDQRSIACERVKDHHRQRWPREYEAFKKGQETPLEGYPLKEWPPMTPAMVATLAAINLHTVEQLSQVSDANLMNVGMGARQLRDKAITWLEQSKGMEPISKLQAELAELRADKELQGKELADLKAAMRAKEEQADA